MSGSSNISEAGLSDAPKNGAVDHPAESPLVAADKRASIGDSLAILAEVADSNARKLTAEREERALSQIERDLLGAEAEFANADARRRQAEEDAQSALASIDQYQSEIDAAIARLRRDSPLGSRWNREAAATDDVLTLKHELPAKAESAIRHQPQQTTVAHLRFRTLDDAG